MVYTCCVNTCKLKSRDSKYHRLPTADSELCQLWISRIGNEDLFKKDTKKLGNYRICHRHFHEMCKLNSRLGLKEFSVPTLHLPNFQGESTSSTCFLSATAIKTD